MLSNFLVIVVCCFFFKFFFFKKIFRKHFQSVKRVGFKSRQHSVNPDLGPNCLPRLSVGGIWIWVNGYTFANSEVPDETGVNVDKSMHYNLHPDQN